MKSTSKTWQKQLFNENICAVSETHGMGKNMIKGIEKNLAKLVFDTAINVEKIPSLWGCYQPKEPKQLIEKLKNDKERFKEK